MPATRTNKCERHTDLEQDHDHTKDYEGMLRERKDSDDSDLGQVVDGASKVETSEPLQELQKAKEKITEDIEILVGLFEETHEALEQSEQEQEELRSRIQENGIS